MRPKEYIARYQALQAAGTFNVQELLRELASEFIALVEFHKTKQWNISIYHNLVLQLGAKFDLIGTSLKLPRSNIKFRSLFSRSWEPAKKLLAREDLSSTPWASLYNRVLIPIYHQEFGPTIRALLNQHREAVADSRAQKRQMEDMAASFREAAFFHLLASFVAQRPVPSASFTHLGLSDTASIEEVQTAFRAKLHACHPDKNAGQSAQEITVSLIDARNQCLAYLGS